MLLLYLDERVVRLEEVHGVLERAHLGAQDGAALLNPAVDRLEEKDFV